jgi:hypothetical protein
MTLLDAVAATSSGYTNTEIAGIITATLMGIAAVGGVIVKFVIARRPVELAEVKREQKREEDESRRIRAQHATFEQLIEAAEERFENEHTAHEKTRERLEGSVQENGRLQEENGQLRFKTLELTDRVERLETSDREKTLKINQLETEVIECHSDRAADMKNTVQWIMDNFVPRNERVTTPPKPRSITPRDMPAIQSSNAARETKT